MKDDKYDKLKLGQAFEHLISIRTILTYHNPV